MTEKEQETPPSEDTSNEVPDVSGVTEYVTKGDDSVDTKELRSDD